MSGQPRQPSPGRPRKSVTTLKLAGGYRADRHGNRPRTSPAPSGASTQTLGAPEGLSESSRLLWRKILDEYAMDDSTPGLELLESALRSRDVAERARDTLERDGLTFTDKHGQPRAHPAAQIHRDARAAYVSTLRTLGFPDFGIE